MTIYFMVFTPLCSKGLFRRFGRPSIPISKATISGGCCGQRLLSGKEEVNFDQSQLHNRQMEADAFLPKCPNKHLLPAMRY